MKFFLKLTIHIAMSVKTIRNIIRDGSHIISNKRCSYKKGEERERGGRKDSWRQEMIKSIVNSEFT